APAERLAFVLHDLFGVPFEEVAPIVGRTPVAARQLASRARRRVQGASSGGTADSSRRREIVDAFLAASRAGNFGELLALLDPEVWVRSDRAAIEIGPPAHISGSEQVAGFFNGAARSARRASIDGEPGAAWAPGGEPRVLFAFRIEHEKIVEIEFIADPA